MKNIILLSGGLDSTTCLAYAASFNNLQDILTLSIVYGQKHEKEIISAKKISDYYNVDNFVLDLSSIFKNSNCSLLKSSKDQIEKKIYAEQLEDKEIVSTYVPFRNGLFLSAITSLAMSLFEESIKIYIGIHKDDIACNAYPDCSETFFKSIAKAIETGTFSRVKVLAPFVNQNKSYIVKTGLKLHAPYHLSWSCYEGGEKPCEKCATCRDRLAAFAANNSIDPLMR